jgi:hypothetical protein
MSAEYVRRSPFAGTWYPAQSAALGSMVTGFLRESPPFPLPGRLVALVSPHAGLKYSGRTAAAGYRLLKDAPFDVVVLLGPSHRVWFDGLSVLAEGAYETPLGRVAIDQELSATIGGTKDAADVHAGEHSLEMQLPFLQSMLEEFRIVPIVMGDQSRENVDEAARTLARAVSGTDRKVLLVASSDLSHYENRSRARELDERVLDCLERFDADELASLLERERRHACGGGPMVSVMRAARDLGASRSSVLHYSDSGDVTGDTDQVVGYVSAAFFQAV